MRFDPLTYNPSSEAEDTIYSPEVWELARVANNTDHPTGEQLYKADQEIRAGWDSWE